MLEKNVDPKIHISTLPHKFKSRKVIILGFLLRFMLVIQVSSGNDNTPFNLVG